MRSPTHADIELANFRNFFSKADLNERQRRLLCGFLASEIGYGGLKAVSEALEVSHMTVRKGQSEYEALRAQTADARPDETMRGRIRRPGGGRKSAVERQPGLLWELEGLLNPVGADGSPCVLSRTTLSLRKLSEQLAAKGFTVSYTVIGQLLEEQGYGKQVNHKMLRTDGPRPDPNEQFAFVDAKAKEFLESGDPVVSIGCEKLGDTEKGKKTGALLRTLERDFPLTDFGNIASADLHVLDDTTALAALDDGSDATDLAGESLRKWWDCVGSRVFAGRRRLFAVCDGDGCREALARLAEQTGLELHVSHLPPGTWKWKNVEHRLFCFRPTTVREPSPCDIKALVQLVGSPTARRELKAECTAAPSAGEHAATASGKVCAATESEPIAPYGEWNYIIRGLDPL